MTASDPLRFQDARSEDLAAILALLSEDAVNPALVPDPSDPRFAQAFQDICDSPNSRLIAVWQGAALVGTLQLAVIHGLSLRALRRMQVEAVRVRADCRGRGIGAAMMHWAVQQAQEAGCSLIQLTTDRGRDGRAKRFYEQLGFIDSHHGMKLRLG